MIKQIFQGSANKPKPTNSKKTTRADKFEPTHWIQQFRAKGLKPESTDHHSRPSKFEPPTNTNQQTRTNQPRTNTCRINKLEATHPSQQARNDKLEQINSNRQNPSNTTSDTHWHYARTHDEHGALLFNASTKSRKADREH